MSIIKLSYDINAKTPLYPGIKGVWLKKTKSIKNGDSCNTYSISLSNHTGTHIDAPNHFFNNGKTIAKIGIKELYFERPLILNCPKNKGEKINVEDVIGQGLTKKADLILLRTGFSKYRHTSFYATKNPYLSYETAFWLKETFPALRAIGIDCISIASYLNRPEGKKAHSVLLSKKLNGNKASPTLIIEDMYIPKNAKSLKSIVVAPLYVKGIDSSPCTIIGFLDD